MLNVRLQSLSVMFSVCLVFGCSEQKKVPVPVAHPVVAAPTQPAASEKIAEPSETKHSPALTAVESNPGNPETNLPVVEKDLDQKPVVTPETVKESAKTNQQAKSLICLKGSSGCSLVIRSSFPNPQSGDW